MNIIHPLGASLNPYQDTSHTTHYTNTAMTQPQLTLTNLTNSDHPNHLWPRAKSHNVTIDSDSNGVHIIPEIPRNLRDHSWEQVIKDWDEKDLSRFHHVALKDWHRDWYHWDKPESVKYCQRRMIALEFIER